MTPEEIQILRSMKPWDAIRKYLPMKISGRITLEEYEWVLRQTTHTQNQEKQEKELKQIAANWDGTVETIPM